LPDAEKDLAFWKSNKAILKRITQLIVSIQETPFEGIGKPELLRYQLSGCWSRRINQEHRLVYEIKGGKILIHSMRGGIMANRPKSKNLIFAQMKNLLLFLFLFTSCHGKLTEEQKRKIREERVVSQIKKISEADVAEASFAYGRNIANIIAKRDTSVTNIALLDSLEKVYDVQIITMQEGDTNLQEVEKQVLEAYASSDNAAALGDNIQKMGVDSILYTKPIIGSNNSIFFRALSVRMPKRRIVLSIK
jgi:toxin YoeB